MNTKLDILKTEIKADNTTTFNFLDMKLSALTSKTLVIVMTNLLIISSNGNSLIYL